MNNVFPFNRRRGLAAAIAIGALAASPMAAADTEKLGDCLKQVHKIKGTSDFVKVEYLSVTQEGEPSFEIEVRDDKGVEWEFMCDADDGVIYEIEQEVKSADDPKFAKHAKTNEQQARQTVTDLYPGTVKEIEYEIESNGSPTYEIDVVDDNDTEWKVEVDAVSGKIIEVHIEKWEIGEEPDERVENNQ